MPERKMMKLVKRIQAGFSLLEVLITMFLVMLGLLVVLSSMVAMAKSNRYSQRMDIANTLARHEMERVRNMNFDAIVSETGAYGEYDMHPDYRHETTVTATGNVKEVVVDVFFENDRRHAEMITYVADL
jgi:type IV pilus assembly protein PilV